MDYFRRFTFLFAAPAFDADDLEGVRFNQIIDEIERSGFQVIKARRLEDAEIAVKTDAAIGCMMVDWGKKGLEGETAALINLMRRRGSRNPEAWAEWERMAERWSTCAKRAEEEDLVLRRRKQENRPPRNRG